MILQSLKFKNFSCCVRSLPQGLYWRVVFCVHFIFETGIFQLKKFTFDSLISILGIAFVFSLLASIIWKLNILNLILCLIASLELQVLF